MFSTLLSDSKRTLRMSPYYHNWSADVVEQEIKAINAGILTPLFVVSLQKFGVRELINGVGLID